MNYQNTIKPDFNLILSEVANFYNISSEEILGQSRKNHIKVARFIFVYLVRNILKFSYPVLGKKLGNRDHTTILHAYKTIERIIKDNIDYSNEVQSIIDSIYGVLIFEESGSANKVVSESDENENRNHLNQKLKYLEEASTATINRINKITEEWKKGVTLKEIGRRNNISRERVRQIVKDGLLYDINDIVKQGILVDLNEYYKDEKSRRILIQREQKIRNSKTREIIKSKVKRWSEYYDQCRTCGTTNIKHSAHGYCEKCYYKTDIFKEIQKASRLRNFDKWKVHQKEYAKAYHKRQYVIEKDRKKLDLINFGGNREKALERDGYKCRLCGISKEENNSKYGKDFYVNHINGKDNNNLDNLITLCKGCHNKISIQIMQEAFRNKVKTK